MQSRFPQASWHYHQWIEFVDKNGRGLAEPELYAVLRDCVVLFEMKLTGGPAGKMQLEGLYAPLLQHIYGKPVLCMLVCRGVIPGTPGPYMEPLQFFQSGLSFATWHWLPY